MPEAGGTATQAGVYYQNSVAALALVGLLDFDGCTARERVVEARFEAPTDVDDVVLRFADGHREFQNVKLSIQIGNSAWIGIWRTLRAQQQALDFSNDDQLSLVIAERNSSSETVLALCERAGTSIDEAELRRRLNQPQTDAFNSIIQILGDGNAVFELLRKTDVVHLSINEIEQKLLRRRVAGGQSPPPALLPLLRDMAGGDARRRGLFQPGPLRRRLIPRPADRDSWGIARRGLVLIPW